MKTSALMISACVSAACFVGNPATAAQQLRLIEHAITETTIDLGAKGDSPGDLLTFGNPVFSADDKIELGKDQGYCVRILAGKSWECFWTLLLAEGQITVEGPYYDDRDSVVAITGGTGKYASARGSMTLHARDAKGSEIDFVYNLL